MRFDAKNDIKQKDSMLTENKKKVHSTSQHESRYFLIFFLGGGFPKALFDTSAV
jgi:hypothetical protein